VIARVRVDGENREHRVTVYVTSRCAPCKKTRKFLKSRSIEYEYLNLDTADHEEREQAMIEIGERLPLIGRKITYPITIIDENTVIYGYDEEALSESLGIR
jgi:glutaredoxin